MRVFELPNLGPRERGRAHGEAFRPLIGEIAAIRVQLCITNGRFTSPEEVQATARAHLPILERYDRDLYEELVGIAEGAALDPSSIVVLNHYTDLKDLDPSGLGAPSGPGDECSAVYARSDAGPLLGQTWDMHGSACPYVMMLHVPAHEGTPAAWLLAITGCLGMTGLNDAGVGIAINNLRCNDARVGLVWPALVRRALVERSAGAARDVILRAPLGSGHHYLVASSEGAFGIETSGTLRKIVYHGETREYVHTNHCFDPELTACTSVGPESTTFERLDVLSRSFEARPIADRIDLWSRLGSHALYPAAVCMHLASPDRPHATSTCGGIVMDLTRIDAWAAAGCIHSARPQRFDFWSREVV